MKTRFDFMFDLETLGPEPDAVILSIGACRFDRLTGEIWDDGFYRSITIKSNVDAGRKIKPETVEWWLQQSEEARLALLAEPRVELTQALIDFAMWAEAFVDGIPGGVRKGARLWSHATFDEVLLRHAFKQAKFTFPFHPKYSRDMRTIVDVGKVLGLKKTKNEDKHNAMADALFQAEQVINVFQALEL